MSATSSTADSHDLVSHEFDEAGVVSKPGPASLVGELKNLITDIEDFISSTATLTGEQLEQAREKARTRIAAAKDIASAASDTAIARARRSAEVANEYVHEQPWAAVGVGVAVGFLTGLICARRD